MLELRRENAKVLGLPLKLLVLRFRLSKTEAYQDKPHRVEIE